MQYMQKMVHFTEEMLQTLEDSLQVYRDILQVQKENQELLTNLTKVKGRPQVLHVHDFFICQCISTHTGTQHVRQVTVLSKG